MADSNGEDNQKEISRINDYFVPANYQPGLMVPQHYFAQHMYYPYVNPYSHLTESNGNMAIHGYGSDGRPKFRRSRTIFSPEQLDILEEQFAKYKYPDVKRRRAIAEELGLPDERVQVWFQNRRAKNKRQTDQQVKLQQLVDEAIGTSSTGADRQHFAKSQRNCDQDVPMSNRSAEEDHQSPFGQHPHGHGVDNDQTFHTPESKIPRLKEPQNENSLRIGSRETVFSENEHGVSLSKKIENPGSSENQNMWSEPNTTSSFGTADAQVVIQSIDQDLLFKVANILSASNDAPSLIAEWSQTPNKVHANNLEEQLRHFAEHHQQFLATGHSSNLNTTPSNHTAQENNQAQRD